MFTEKWSRERSAPTWASSSEVSLETSEADRLDTPRLSASSAMSLVDTPLT